MSRSNTIFQEDYVKKLGIGIMVAAWALIIGGFIFNARAEEPQVDRYVLEDGIYPGKCYEVRGMERALASNGFLVVMKWVNPVLGSDNFIYVNDEGYMYLLVTSERSRVACVVSMGKELTINSKNVDTLVEADTRV